MKKTKLLSVTSALLLAMIACNLFGDGPGPAEEAEGLGAEVFDRDFSITGKVWLDINADGMQDDDEPGESGVTVKLLTTGNVEIDSTITDANGEYKFGPLGRDDYFIQVVAPERHAFSAQDQGVDSRDSDVLPVTGLSPRVDFSSAQPEQIAVDLDAGLIPPEIVAVSEDVEAVPPEVAEKTTRLLFLGYFTGNYRHLGATSEITALLVALFADPEPLANATITMTMTSPDGSTETLTGVTDQSGVAEITFPIFVFGSYTLTVDDVQAEETDLVYDPSLNLATSLMVEVGAAEGAPVAAIDRVVAFYNGYNAAFKNQDVASLLQSLHPAVFDLYGQEACAAYLETVFENTIEVEVLSVTEFGDWEWLRDERTQTVSNAYTVQARVIAPDGNSQQQEIHVALRDDASIGWFTDCGEPLP